MIITDIKSVDEFHKLLEKNNGLFIVKFGAVWCSPCKVIEKDVNTFFASAPPNVTCAIIDVDKSPSLYGFLKSKKMVNGVPAILCYHKGNCKYVPDDFTIGSDKTQLYAFFDRCRKQATEYL